MRHSNCATLRSKLLGQLSTVGSCPFHLRVCGGHMFTRSTLFAVKYEENKTSENALDSSSSLTHLLPMHPFSTN